MTIIKSLAVAATALFALAACKNADYKKTSSGMMYKIISDGKEPQVKIGQYIKVNFTQKINDSVLASSYGGVPVYVRVDSVGAVYNPSEIFRFLRKGDSAIVVQMADTLIARMMAAPFMKKGDKLKLSFRVEDVFSDDSTMSADRDKAMQKQTELAQANFDAAIAKKNLNAQKTKGGTFVVVNNPGNGAAADSGKYISVRYTGKIMETDKMFESNADTSKPAFSFVIGQGQVIPGWDEGLRFFKKGGKGTLYIPGAQAYGPRPGPGGKPFESLVFDVEVVDVQDKMPAPPAPPVTPPADAHGDHKH